MNRLRRYKKYSFIPIDIVCMVLAYLFTLLLRCDNGIPKEFMDVAQNTVAVANVFVVICMLIGRGYDNLWKYSSIKDYMKTMVILGIATILLLILKVCFPAPFITVKIILFSNFIGTIMIVGSRICARVVLSLTDFPNRKDAGERTLIIGSGSAAKLLIDDIQRSNVQQYYVVGLIDDNPEKIGRYIGAHKVLGDRKSIVAVCQHHKIEVIIIAIPSAHPVEMQKLITICSETGCKVKLMPSIDRMISDEKAVSSIRDVEIEDLLERDPILLDNDSLQSQISGKTVMVTGGGGSIGSELCRQIAKYNPGKLIVLDCYENNAYDLQQELRYQYPELSLDTIIASVRDEKRLHELFEHYRPQLVFHAAAHKHVPLMEKSPQEAIKNNVFGTWNTVHAAHQYGVEKFVLISTDKAVNPTNVMGATKRICEMITQAMQPVSQTDFVAVRFGNVLGSNGSVIPLFKRQLKHGGPLTVTHKDITRYFMTIPEAAQLVLQAASFAHGGEIFVLDMGRPVRIYDLAEKLIRLSGYTPNKDIKIHVTGLRPGEKLYEELLMAEEGLTNTSHNKIFIGQPLGCEYQSLSHQLDELKEVLWNSDADMVKRAVAKIVDTYSPDLDCDKQKA